MALKKQRGNSKPIGTTPGELAQQAQLCLETGRFRDAIERFKALIKSQPSPDHNTGLAAAYAGRARELYAKGMIKEALAIWDNRRQFCPQSPPDSEHITALLQSGQIATALGLIRKNNAQLDPNYLTNLQVRLAALYLAGNTDIAKNLDKDDPIIRHGIPARSALEAYCRGDDAAVATALADIPFRSPYRDWVQILRTLLKLATDSNSASVLLQKVQADSPFTPLKSAVELVLLPPSAIEKAFTQVTRNARRFAAPLLGWTTNRLQLWNEVQHLGEYPTAMALEQFMYKHMQVLGKDWVQQQGLSLLVEKFPLSLTRTSLFKKNELTPLQKSLVAAWREDKHHDVAENLDVWQKVIAILRTPTDPAPESDNALRIAIIQRNLEQRLKLLDQQKDACEHINGKRINLVSQGCELLESSLLFDPDSLPTYIRLIAHYRIRNKLKDARRLLTTALERWPDEPALLGEAMDTATAGEAFKKATTYARRLLALDPINRRARNSLLDAHLAHAHKQIINRSFALAEKEFAAAEEWVKDDQARLRLNIRRGFLLLAQNKSAGIAAFKALLAPPLDNLTTRLLFAIDALRMNIPVQTFMPQFALPKTLNIHDFMTFLRTLQEAFNQYEQSFPSAILDYFNPALKRARELNLSAEDYEFLCETLRICDLNKLRLLHASAALESWPHTPIFELHVFEAKYSKNTKKIENSDIERLRSAMHRAQQANDKRTARRIHDVLEEVAPSDDFSNPFSNPFANPFENPLELYELVEELGVNGLIAAIKEDPDLFPALNEIENKVGKQGLRMLLQTIYDEIHRK